MTHRSAVATNAFVLALWGVLGVSVLYGLWFKQLADDDRTLLGGHHVTARVTRVYDLDLLAGQAGSFLEYSFRTQDGAGIIAASEVSDATLFRVDQPIRIVYRPAHPNQAELRSVLAERMRSSRVRSIAAVGVAVLAICLLYLVRWHERFFRRSQPNHQPPQPPTPSNH